MSIRDNAFSVQDRIFPQNVLVSVFDKTGLDVLVKQLIGINPGVMFYSTGGTGKKILEILGETGRANYSSVEEFTGAPEMEGGLVKTIHPKIAAGLLAERDNPAHERYLQEEMAKFGKGPGVYFDIFVGNLYPFEAVVYGPEGATPEKARGNIDIGGPNMTMAAAKNWPSVAALSEPAQYLAFVASLQMLNGTDLKLRFNLARRAFMLVGMYRQTIGTYFSHLEYERDVLPTLKVKRD